MGLDGISVNQLRITPENNSAELNNVARFSLNTEHKIVDGLSQGQKIDPDQQNERDDTELAQHFESSEENEEIIEEEIIKYDLSDNNKYILKLDEQSNNILIIEKSSQLVVQKIDANELSNYVGYLSNSQGSLVNRKF